MNAPGIPDGSLTGGVYVGSPEAGARTRIGRGVSGSSCSAEAAQYGVGLHLEGRVEANAHTGRLTRDLHRTPRRCLSNTSTLHFNGGQRARRWPTRSLRPGRTRGDDYAIRRRATGERRDERIPRRPQRRRRRMRRRRCRSRSCRASRRSSRARRRIQPVHVQPQQRATGSSTSPNHDHAAGRAARRDPLGAAVRRTERQRRQLPGGSQIGTVSVAAGAGSEPYNFTGHAYLTGPYDGAPYGLSVVVPAVAGPYDLGEVSTRAGHQRRPVQRKGDRRGHPAHDRRRRAAAAEEPERCRQPPEASCSTPPAAARSRTESAAELHPRRHAGAVQPVPGRQLRRAGVQAEPQPRACCQGLRNPAARASR